MTTYIIITCAIALVLNTIIIGRGIVRNCTTDIPRKQVAALLALFVVGQIVGSALCYLVLVTWLGWATFVALNTTVAVLMSGFAVYATK